MLHDVISGLISTLNLIEVRGQTNLALLYNAIDTLNKLKKGEVEGVAPQEEDDDNMAIDA